MIELHCHSNASDGSLTPTELVELAHKNGITDLALTDHDSIAGIAEAEAVAAPLGMNIIPGTELSCEFGSGELHIVGLFIDTKCPALKQFYDDLELSWLLRIPRGNGCRSRRTYGGRRRGTSGW